MSAPTLELTGVGKSFGAHEVLRGVDLVGQAIRGRLPDRPERLGQEHASAVRELSRILRRRRSAHRRQADRLRGHGRRNASPDGRAATSRNAARDRHGVPALQSLAAHDRASQRRRAAKARARLIGARGGRAGDGDAHARRACRQGRRLSLAFVGRPAAARRHCAGAGDAAAPDAVRRTDLGARSRTRRRSFGGDARASPPRA